MKKMITIVGLCAVVSGVALAASLHVPFFNDDTTAGYESYIGVKNTTDAPIVVTVMYFTNNGQLAYDANDNTFVLNANSGIGFAPGQDDPAKEGYDSEGNKTPNMTGGNAKGSALLMWSGGPQDVVGRLVGFSPSGAFAYLLPTGKAG